MVHPFTVVQVAKQFFENIYELYGLPRSIVCDRDPIFVCKFWRELFRLEDSSFNMSSSYHPQTDGQSKAVNKSLEMYMRCLGGDSP